MPIAAGSNVMAALPVWTWRRRFVIFCFLIIVVVITLASPLEAVALAPVYWNSSNSIFKSSRNDHIIEVNLQDEIDFICPLYPSSIRNDSLLEYYLIYRVSETEYRECSLYSKADTLLLLNCSTPHVKRRYTIIFEPHQSIPNAPEYKPGMTYYFITTSTGTRPGMTNAYHGACRHQNMKLKIKLSSNNPDSDYSSHSREEEKDGSDDDDDYDDGGDNFHSPEPLPRLHTRRHHHQHLPTHNTPPPHYNKRIQATRPPTFEDSHHVPRPRGGHRSRNNTYRRQQQQQLQKTQRRQTQRNTTAVPDPGQQGNVNHQQQQLYRSNKASTQNIARQHQHKQQLNSNNKQSKFHFSQVPSSATISHKILTTFGFHIFVAAAMLVIVLTSHLQTSGRYTIFGYSSTIVD